MSLNVVHLILWVATLSYCFQFGVAGSNETDREALLEIKAKISDPLDLLSSWNDSLHFCEWTGVYCGRRHQRVTELDLSSSKLTGTLSPFVGNLSFLRGLWAYNNSFTGQIPPDISRLHRLQVLSLYNNSFGGEIPPNLTACSRLTFLYLHNNKLEGGIPAQLGSLSHLQELYLAPNNLTGIIPSSLGNLSSLSILDLMKASFVGSIPDSLGRLKNLQFLTLLSNKLLGKVPPSIYNLSSLSYLVIGDNQLEGSLPPYVGSKFTLNLQEFSIFVNRFTGHIPSWVSNLSNVELLQLGTNHLEGQVPCLNKLHKLQKFNINSNFLGAGKPSDLSFIPSLVNATMSLHFINIGGNNFGGTFPNAICNFSKLHELFMWGNNMVGHIPNCIENVANLEWFDASYNHLFGPIPFTIGKLHKMYNLHLEGNRLSGHVPSTLGNLTQLGHLFLSENNFEGHIPSAIGNCSNLEELDLSGNKFEGHIPSQLVGLHTLSILLDLSSNHLTGPLPTEVGQLKSLNALDISNNMLSGKIPSTLSACTELEILDMGGNFFQGEVPSALATLRGLRELNLSRNNLSGEIPKFLAMFHLQVLDLSFNNFKGEVPSGGVFNNATSVSLLGNSRLCGGIPELKMARCNFSSTQFRTQHYKVRLVLAILSGFCGCILLVAFASWYAFCYGKRSKKSNDDESKSIPIKFSYQTLHNVTNGFSSENLIGSGTFGDVYKGTLDDEGRTTVAIKKFKLEHKGASRSFMAECEALRNVRHRNLVKVITVCSSIDYQGNDFKALVYEYMVNGSLEDWLHPNPITNAEGTSFAPRNLNLLQRLGIAVDVGFALEYLHHRSGAPIIHCDLKPSNVLLDDEMVAHVGDFGLAKLLCNVHVNQSSSIGVRGTVGYAPPEYGLGNELSTSGDVYSFGILLLELFTGKRPVDNMFKDGLSLHGYVKVALPQQVTEILDPILLRDVAGDEETGTTTSHILSRTRKNYREAISDALNSVLEIGLSCSAELPQDRLDMSDAAAKLALIRNKLLGTRL